MYLESISSAIFDTFAKSHPLGSFHQTTNYALYAKKEGFNCEFIGLFDKDKKIVAASLILFKRINFFTKYGYAPKGFLIDYNNVELLSIFTEKIKKYYYNKNVAFIKINPEITVGQLDFKKKKVLYNKNRKTENKLQELHYRKRYSIHFETKIPKYNAIIILKNTTLNTLEKNTRNKINKSKKNGLTFIKGNRDSLETIYKFVEKKKEKKISHYLNYYNAFQTSNQVDLFLIKVDFEKCLLNYREKYKKEVERNAKLVERVMLNPNEKNLNKKLESDKALNLFNEYIKKATDCLAKKKEDYIAGAITIKYKNRVQILISGFDKNFQALCPNHFLHYSLIEHYKKEYDFLELNGITGDFSNQNPYKGLNDFKMGFNPLAFEYIGEFDLIINEGLYKSLELNGFLAKEFKRKEKVLIIQD